MIGWPRFVKGIREKLLLSFSLLVASIAVFVFAFFPTRLQRQAMRAVIAKAEAIRDLSAYSVSAGLFFGDTAAVRDVLAGAARDEEVQLIVVRDTAGVPVAIHGAASRSVRGVSANGAGFVTADGRTYVTTSVVVHGRTRIGSVTVGISLSQLQREVATARWLGALMGSLIFVVGFVIVYAISTLVTRPLTAVATTVQRIAAGDLSLRAVETSDAEVSQLVRAFNHMVDSLAGAQAELSAINQQLEARVDARTAELREANVEQRRAQIALTQSEGQARATSVMLQSLIDTAPQAIVVVDLAWNITRWNQGAERMFLWTADEVLGRPIPYVPDEERAKFRTMQSLLSNGEGDTLETVRLRKDGHRIVVLVSTAILRDQEQHPVGYIAVITDLTERKSLEEQLHQSQKMEAIGRLAGGIAHDFNNMLTVITSCAAMLLDSARSKEEQQDLEAIATSAMRASSLTRQLLLFSRKQVVNLHPVNVSYVVQEMEPMLRRLLRENIRFRAVPGCGQSFVIADPSQLEQVIMNLVVNASDAMPDGGSLTIETRSVDLDAEYAHVHPDVAPGSYEVLTVSDTGIGMDAATIDKIFEPFFTTKEVGHGTGLGLATTYAVVSQLGGHIRVYSEPGQGAAFKIFLPHAAETNHRQRSTPSSSAATLLAGGPATILLVEDEESVRRTIRRTLERFGYSILEASDGEMGLSVAAAHPGPIDVVVTDLMMPGMNGRDFADVLLAARPGLRVIFISGYTDATVSQRGLVDETHTFLQKPFAGAQLGKAIRELLQEEAPARVSATAGRA